MNIVEEPCTIGNDSVVVLLQLQLVKPELAQVRTTHGDVAGVYISHASKIILSSYQEKPATCEIS